MSATRRRRTPKREGRKPKKGSRFLSEAVAKNLSHFRDLRDCSQDQLAERMQGLGHTGWSRATVSEVERQGRTLSVDELLSLALILDAPIGDLLDPTSGGHIHQGLDIGLREPMKPTLARLWVQGRARVSVTWDERERKHKAISYSPTEGSEIELLRELGVEVKEGRTL